MQNFKISKIIEASPGNLHDFFENALKIQTKNVPDFADIGSDISFATFPSSKLLNDQAKLMVKKCPKE